jgi:hypothetical protein
MGRSILEQIEAQGEARGEARGRELGTRTALERELTARFGPLLTEAQQAVANADVEIMSIWLDRAATAQTLQEVGILPPETEP